MDGKLHTTPEVEPDRASTRIAQKKENTVDKISRQECRGGREGGAGEG